MKILNSKLLLPTPVHTIARERLSSILDGIFDKRLTTVIAGAGYGKTTLISQACSKQASPVVWYRLDREDNDFVIFLRYLVSGLQKHFPHFGTETLTRMETVRVLNREVGDVLTFFLSELEAVVHNDIVIVLDDFHLIQGIREIDASMKFLIERLPPFVHVILISRSDTGLPLSRLQAKWDILEINEDDLAFTVDEIETLFLRIFNISIGKNSLINLHRKSRGWVSGLILFYHALKRKHPDEIDILLSTLEGSHTIIQKYLEENVYDLLPEEVQRFLSLTSILSKLTVTFCDRLLNIANSGEILIYLEKNHLFTFPEDLQRKSYQYHHLFKDYLQQRLERQNDPELISQLHKNAATLYENEGDVDEAVEHYLKARQMNDVCRLLDDIGRKMLWKGRLVRINTCLSRVPDQYFDNEPWIQYMKAQSLDLCGKSHQAISVYQKTLANFRKRGSGNGEILCLMEIGRNYFTVGDLHRAEITLKELLRQNDLDPLHRFHVIVQMVFISSYLGKMKRSDQYVEEAILFLPEDESERRVNRGLLLLSQSFRYHFAGDYEKALDIGNQAKMIFRDPALPQHLSLYYQMASNTYWFQGNFLKGYSTAQKGLKIVEACGFMDNYAWFQLLLAINAYGMNKVPEALNHGTMCLGSFRDTGNLQGQAAACLALNGACLKSGDLGKAFDYAQQGLHLIKNLSLPMIKGELNGRMAEILIRKHRYNDAWAFLKDAEKSLKGFKWYEFWVLCLQSKYFWEQGQKEPAYERILSALKLCEANHYEYWIIEKKQWITTLLIYLHNHGCMQGYIKSLLNKIGPEVENELAAIRTAASQKTPSASTMDMEALFFGKFELRVKGRSVVSSQWKSQKALMLFKYLMYFRAKGYIRKEVLMELLWPDDDPKKTANRFHVAMNALRKTLEPDLEKGAVSSCIQNIGDSYCIHPGDNHRVDTETFLAELNDAEKENHPEISITHLLAAESIYRDDFLVEDGFIPWCDDERDRLRKKYLGVLFRILEYFENKNEYTKCIDFASRYIDREKYDETLYRKLMRYYSNTGNKSMVYKTFEQCKNSIEKELECPVSRETVALYGRLLNG